MEVLESLSVGGSLQVGLLTEDAELERELAGGELCWTVNGEVCHCFPGSIELAAAGLHFPASCAAAATASELSFFYFAVEITLSGRPWPLVSLPKRVALRQSGSWSVRAPGSTATITLVLPLSAADLPRAQILMASLARVTLSSAVHCLLVLTPESDREAVEASLSNSSLAFPVLTLGESDARLLGNTSTSASIVGRGYAVQMALKLLAARLVQTDYYLTLDADVVLLQPTLLSRLHRRGRAVYEDEARFVHPDWWQSSSWLLGLNTDGSVVSGRGAHYGNGGFSVTPAMLSTYGALVTVARVRTRISSMPQAVVAEPTTSWVGQWIQSLGATVMFGDASTRVQTQELGAMGEQSSLSSVPKLLLWSEYTLYRLWLDEGVGLFSSLHVREEDDHIDVEALSPPSSLATPRLHCFDVWFAHQLPWPAEQVSRMLKSGDLPCVFSVVQSTSGADVGQLWEQLSLLWGGT